MRLVRMLAVLALLGAAAVARAEETVKVDHPSTAGVVLRDTVAGGLLGSGVAGGIIFYNMGIKGRTDYDWGRTLAWGAAIGVGVGLVLGFAEAATRSYGMSRPPVRDGLSTSLDAPGRDQSGMQVFPVVLRGF